MRATRAVIMGGSLGGLTAALTLCDLGYTVDVYERSQVPLSGQGAGIVLHPATVRYFTEHRTANLEEISVATDWVRYMGNDGAIIHTARNAYRFSSYNALYESLLQSFDRAHYHLGVAVTDFAQDTEGVTVHLSDGHAQRADLLVCADGIRSSARRRLLNGLLPRYAGYVAWRGTINAAELSSTLFTELRSAITYHVLPNSHLLIYPIPVVDPLTGTVHTNINWLWYRNVAEGAQLDALLTDRQGIRRDISLPPGMVRDDPLAELRADARTLPPPIAQVIAATAEPFLQAIMDLSIPRMAFDRICLIGDAAFVARPHAAAGTAKAAEDAWTLSVALAESSGDVVAALRRWEPGQMRMGSALLERTQEAGYRSQVANTWHVGDLLPFGLYETGDSMMPTT